ncbi:hypothetical protein LWI29_006637 [Acer saccharum]|uniref:Uncharacterized protein n=1 Tax=Acer saccharum TaxID=4024 RepID=A0AA39RVE0_ACESA|nr:hypothetical protein LWI29_006637 [Acer saccharum]
MPMATATATATATVTRTMMTFCLSFLSLFLVCCCLGLRFLCCCLGLGASFNADGDATVTLCFSFLSLFLVCCCLGLQFHTEQSFCDGDGDDDEGNGDLHGNGDLLLLLPLTLGFLVVVVVIVCIRTEQSFNFFSIVPLLPHLFIIIFIKITNHQTLTHRIHKPPPYDALYDALIFPCQGDRTQPNQLLPLPISSLSLLSSISISSGGKEVVFDYPKITMWVCLLKDVEDDGFDPGPDDGVGGDGAGFEGGRGWCRRRGMVAVMGSS